MRTGFYSILLSVLTVVLLIGAGVGSALAAVQSVELSPNTADQPVGSSFTLSAFYEVDDNDNTLTGLGVRFHFDSTKLQFTGYSNLLQTDLLASEAVPQDDPLLLNYDGDASTDKYVSIAWVSAAGNWPNETLPLELVQLGFEVNGDAAVGPTPVNVSFIDSAVGYMTDSTDSVITVTVPPGSITGIVAYTGSATGTFEIGAYSDENMENLVAQTTLNVPGNFEIADVPPGMYYVGAELDIVDYMDREPGGQAGAPVTVVSGQSVDAGTITVYHIATNVVLEAIPSNISSTTPSESILTATIWDDHEFEVTEGPDSTLEVSFAVTDPTYGIIKVGETNPVAAVNGVATITIVSEVHATGGDIPCTADATGAQGQGDLTQGTVTVTTGPFSIVPAGPVALLVNQTQEFNVVGGVAPYNWGVDGGALDKSTTQTEDEKVVFTAPELETTGITITVTDSDSTPVESQATINVYEAVEIPDKPAEPPVVEAGDTSSLFTVEGGDGSYTWTVTDSSGATIDTQEGNSYAFPAPSDQAYGGVYKVTVTDGNGFSDSFDVFVPMQYTPQSNNITGGEAFDLVLAGARSSGPDPVIDPAAEISTVEFLILDENQEEWILVPEEEMGDYATFAPDLPIPFDGNSEATLTLTGADVTDVMMFQLRATVTGDEDLTEENGLNVATTGWMRVFPVVIYSGTVQKADAVPAIAIENATVIFNLGGAIQGVPISTAADGTFSTADADLQLLSPEFTGAEYQVIVLADDYVSRTDLTTADWDLEDGEPVDLTIELVPAESSVTGTVNDTVGPQGDPIEGALVECTVGDDVCLAYADAGGNYTLQLPEPDPGTIVTTTWDYETTNNYADPDPCVADEDDTGTATMTQTGSDVTIVVDGGPTYTGTADGTDYILSTTYEDNGETCTETVAFTLSLSGTEGLGELTWSCTEDGVTCNGGSVLNLTRQNGGTFTGLFARASAAGYEGVTQDILVDPDFQLPALSPGDEVTAEGGTLTSGECTIDIPAGTLDGPAQIDFLCDIDVGMETPHTQHSVALVEIAVTGANIDPDNPIQVTIPFDTAGVNPGDFQAGIARIYYADTADDLRNGTNVNGVSTEDIIYEDHLNGLTSFWLGHTSVFGVGAAGTPAITGPATSVRSKTAILTGTVNPNGLPTTYHFEYGRDTNYGMSTPEADAGSGSDDVAVSANIGNLDDDTTYHFRLAAMNSAGITYGEDATFKTNKHGKTCFIQTAAHGFSAEQLIPLHIGSAHKTLLVIVMFGLAAVACMLLRRVR